MPMQLSIEFFPPQTREGFDKLRATREKLSALRPDFFSVTFGAGGSTRERTFAVCREIADAGQPVAPHLSCVGSTRENIREILADYRARGRSARHNAPGATPNAKPNASASKLNATPKRARNDRCRRRMQSIALLFLSLAPIAPPVGA